jgi:hypothetical protein
LWLTNKGQYYWQNQNHLMKCAAEKVVLSLGTIYHKASCLPAP